MSRARAGHVAPCYVNARVRRPYSWQFLSIDDDLFTGVVIFVAPRCS